MKLCIRRLITDIDNHVINRKVKGRAFERLHTNQVGTQESAFP